MYFPLPDEKRIGVALVGGKLWSSGTQDRVRTARLRRDPRCTIFVFDATWRWLTLETTVRILDGTDAPGLNLRLFHQMQGLIEQPRHQPVSSAALAAALTQFSTAGYYGSTG